MITKICKKCKCKLLLNNFRRRSDTSSGFGVICKSCANKIRKESGESIRYYLKNKNAILNREKKWRQNHADIVKERKSIYYQKNKNWLNINTKIHGKRYRDKSRMLDMNYTSNDQNITYNLFNFKCFNCKSQTKLTIDHHYPLSSGNGLSLNNAVLLCGSCNSSKHDKMPEEFYDTIQFNNLEYILSIATANLSGWY